MFWPARPPAFRTRVWWDSISGVLGWPLQPRAPSHGDLHDADPLPHPMRAPASASFPLRWRAIASRTTADARRPPAPMQRKRATCVATQARPRRGASKATGRISSAVGAPRRTCATGTKRAEFTQKTDAVQHGTATLPAWQVTTPLRTPGQRPHRFAH
jgi:hypothetical protein